MAFPDSDEHVAQQIAGRLRTSIMARRFEVNRQMLVLTLNCGISRYRTAEALIDDAIRRADDAL